MNRSPQKDGSIPALASPDGAPWTIVPTEGEWGLLVLGLHSADSDDDLQVPDFALTRENALRLAGAIRDRYGITEAEAS